MELTSVKTAVKERLDAVDEFSKSLPEMKMNLTRTQIKNTLFHTLRLNAQSGALFAMRHTRTFTADLKVFLIRRLSSRFWHW